MFFSMLQIYFESTKKIKVYSDFWGTLYLYVVRSYSDSWLSCKDSE